MADVTYIVKLPEYPTMAPVTFTASDSADAATLRARALEAVRPRLVGAHLFQDDLQVSIYRDANSDGTAQDSERLGINGSGSVGAWNAGNGVNRFSNPFRVNVRPASGDVVRGMVTRPDRTALTQVAGDDADHPWVLPSDVRLALGSLDFRSDGVERPSREEALRYIREFERIFRGRTFRFGNPPRDVPGEELMRRVINEGYADLGPTEGRDTISAIYNTAGLDSSAAGSRTDADFARFIENPGLSTAPGAAPADPSITDFLANPTPANAARLRADKARTDELINALLAALASGNTDVLTTVMDLVARNGRGTVAQLAMNTITQLRSVDENIARVNTRIAGLNLGAADATARARATGEFQQANVELAALNSTRQSIIQMLETALRAMEEENRTAQRVSEAYARAHMAGVR